jgi:hypothetical protein
MPIGIPAILGISAAIGGGSAAAGALSNTKKARTSTQDQTTSRVMRPEQEAAMQVIQQTIQRLTGSPDAGLDPYRTAGVADINQQFAAAQPRLESSMAARGVRGGGLKKGSRQLELSRVNALGSFNNSVGQLALQRQDQGVSLAERLAAMNFGQRTQGTSVAPGSALGSGLSAGLGSGLESLGSLFALSKFGR